jgi:hypothetical protein
MSYTHTAHSVISKLDFKKCLQILGSHYKAPLVHSLHFYRTVLTDEQSTTLVYILVLLELSAPI